ncbi:amino acid transporter [Pelomyxa schiedti]|nr:amino acid transporter [Pelomyxa schiedti]
MGDDSVKFVSINTATPDAPDSALFQSSGVYTADLMSGEGASIPDKTVGTMTGTAILINYIIGMGVFSLPYAFYVGGVSLASISLLMFSGLLIITAFWVLEIMSRAHGYNTAQRLSTHPKNILEYDKYDYTRFCYIFGRMPGKVLCQIAMALYVYGCLWGYAASFASTLSIILFNWFSDESCDVYDPNRSDVCTYTYYASVGLFALITLPICLLDLAKQAFLQLFLTAYRFTAFGTMMLTTIIALFVSGPLQVNGSSGSNSGIDYSFLGFKWSGFSVMFGSTAVALTMHYNLPNAIAPVRNKSRLRAIVLGAMCVALFFYMAVGVICSVFFNSYTEPLIVLNWTPTASHPGYTGHAGGWGAGDTLWWAYIVQIIIQFFPILNLINNFPLVSITLGSNFEEWAPVRWRKTKPRLVRWVCVLIAGIPPILLSLYESELDSILAFTGMFSFFLVFIIPCVFQVLSRWTLTKKYGKDSDKTMFSGYHSWTLWVIIIGVIGIGAWVFSLVDMFCEWFHACLGF